MENLKDILAEHEKWLNDSSTGKRANLSGADLSSANLSGADLSSATLICANLRVATLICANLSGAFLSVANLRDSDLSEANLRVANLSGANLICANLICANLSSANLICANLSGANLSGANLSGANLSGAVGISIFGPVGNERRIGYVVKHENGAMVKLGCFWGTEEEASKAIIKKYGEGSTYELFMRAACRVVMK